MASKLDITLKRFNGSTIDELFPTTHLGQIYTNSAQTKLLNTYLDETFINVNQRGAANGVATLDQFQKLTASQLPAYLFGGMTYAGALSLSTEKTIDDIMEAASPGNTANKLSAVGEYLQVSSNGNLAQGSTWTATVLAPGDEGDTAFPIHFEAGDWIVVNAIDHANNTVTFAVVNNTYRFADSTDHGLVRLTNATNAGQYHAENNATGLVNGSIDVVTEDFLFDNIANGELNGGTAGANNVSNKIAAADHIHDGRYYTETEVAAFFGGSTAITGYAKANWDTAYNDKINSASFNTGNGILTLTQQDEGTVTVDLDGRYVETETDPIFTAHTTFNIANGTGLLKNNGSGTWTYDNTTYTTEALVRTDLFGNLLVYGANPTSEVTGAILIDLD